MPNRRSSRGLATDQYGQFRRPNSTIDNSINNSPGDNWIIVRHLSQVDQVTPLQYRGLMFPTQLSSACAALVLVACGPSGPTGPSDQDIASWAGEQSWDLDEFERPQQRRAWIHACLGDVPTTCAEVCDLRPIQAPVKSDSVPNSYQVQSYRLIRITPADSARAECSAFAPVWESSWRSPWIGPIATTWQVSTDARTGAELSAEQGTPMRRRLLLPTVP